MRSRTELFLAVLALLLLAACGEPAALPSTEDLDQLLAPATPPTAEQAERLVELLEHPAPSVREAVLERLRGHARVAAAPVTRRLTQPGLIGQLASLELLRSWKAPVDAADPWDPATLAAARAPLEKWAAAASSANVTTTAAPPAARELDEDFELLLGPDDERADAALERLVRSGAGARTRLRATAPRGNDPRLRRRLDMLRFRLAMPIALLLRSPDLAYRLAIAGGRGRALVVSTIPDADVQTARPLLHELVADPEPLVREAALKRLRKTDEIDQMTRLLSDPDPNVRAAVLKELASAPADKMAKALKDYTAKETDEDLLVHAVRALSEIKGHASLKAMLALARHPRWRVRAEVIERVDTRIAKGAFQSLPADVKLKIGDAVVHLLDDTDAYVAGRAVQIAKTIDQPRTLLPLTRIVTRHPKLAASAVEAMDALVSMKAAVESRLKQYATAGTGDVRATAIAALIRRNWRTTPETTLPWLSDRDARVRTAAIAAVATEAKTVSVGPTLTTSYVAVIKRNLPGAGEPERVAIARALTHMRQHADAVPLLKAILAKSRDRLRDVTDALAALEWADRKGIYDALHAGGTLDGSSGVKLLDAMLEGRPPQARTLVWQVLGDPKGDPVVFAHALESLFTVYGAPQYVLSPDDEPTKELVADAATRLDSGKPALTSVALMIVMMRRRELAEPVARALLDDTKTDAELAVNALKLLLCARGVTAKRKLALAALARGGSSVEPALSYLALGRRAQALTKLTVAGRSIDVISETWNDTSSVAPLPPPDLTADLLAPHLKNTDRTALYAAHLLALLGDERGVPVLAERWRDDPDDAEQRLLILDALVILDREQDAGLLEEVVSSMTQNGGTRLEALERLGLMTNRRARALLRRVRPARGAPVPAPATSANDDADDLLGLE